MLLNPASQAIQRSGLFTITEERGWWVKGRTSDNLCFEVSFEDSNAIRAAKQQDRFFPHPRVPVTYLGLWLGRRTVAEFQLGTWFKRPDEGADAYILSQLLHPLLDARPVAVVQQVPSMFILGGAVPRASSASTTTSYL